MNPDIFTKVDTFFSKYPKRSYPKDHIIVFSGDNPNKVFYIVSGKISQYDISYRGDEVITNIFKSPAFFPMSLALNNSPNYFFYKAETDVVVHCAPPSDVTEFLKANPDITLNLLSRVYSGLDGVLGRMVHLMSGTARTRLIYELVIECRRFGTPKKDSSYTLDVNETQLASRSGLSRETISREISKLKDISLISMQANQILVLNLPKLERLLGPKTDE